MQETISLTAPRTPEVTLPRRGLFISLGLEGFGLLKVSASHKMSTTLSFGTSVQPARKNEVKSFQVGRKGHFLDTFLQVIQGGAFHNYWPNSTNNSTQQSEIPNKEHWVLEVLVEEVQTCGN